MDWTATTSAFVLLVLAEFGDKSQLVAISLGNRYRLAPVIAGVFAAFVLLNLLAVSLGAALYLFLPAALVYTVAALVFFGFAWRCWIDREAEHGGEISKHTTRSIVITSFVLILFAELGDKTQITVATLAGTTGELMSVFAGATLALWTVALAGMVIGATLLRRFPARYMHRAAAVLFAVFGLIAALYAWREIGLV